MEALIRIIYSIILIRFGIPLTIPAAILTLFDAEPGAGAGAGARFPLPMTDQQCVY